jgi:hypothetical protein
MRASLWFFASIHALALVTMLVLLRPGMDVAAFSVSERAQYVADHARAWRLGWLPWQLSALSDLWVSFAFWRLAVRRRAAEARRVAAWALVLFAASAAPEQWAEAHLVTSFVAEARRNPSDWQQSWTLYAALTGVWANLGYTVMTYCWMKCASLLLGRSVLLPRLELGLLGAFVVSGLLTGMATMLASDATVGAWFTAASAVNGIAFPALIVWSLLLVRRLSQTVGDPQTDRGAGSSG